LQPEITAYVARLAVRRPDRVVAVEEVRRADDDELCGYVEVRDGQWCSLVVFGAELGRHDSRESARDQVLRDGLAVLAERWMLREAATGDDRIVCIQEAHPGAVTLALDYYSMPGVPTMTVTSQQLASGEWALYR
jgi:hypothetical protein